MDMPLVVCFCFPQLTVALAFQPSNVLLLNPMHYHCVSQWTLNYALDKVYVTLFYMKTSQTSLNNNSIPIVNLWPEA
jgi:hypothetical protein